MKIYKACPEYWYDRMEAYYSRLEDAVDAVNRFMEEICKKWALRYHFIGTETNGDVTTIQYEVITLSGNSWSPIRTMPAVMAVELNGLEEKT